MMKRSFFLAWVRLMLSGGLLFGSAAAGCLANQLRFAGDQLNALADDVHDDRNDFQRFIDDVRDLF